VVAPAVTVIVDGAGVMNPFNDSNDTVYCPGSRSVHKPQSSMALPFTYIVAGTGGEVDTCKFPRGIKLAITSVVTPDAIVIGVFSACVTGTPPGVLVTVTDVGLLKYETFEKDNVYVPAGIFM
jgi:hypothetical protein